MNLPGGTLEITVLPDLSNVLMKGPAVHVFDGELDLGEARRARGQATAARATRASAIATAATAQPATRSTK